MKQGKIINYKTSKWFTFDPIHYLARCVYKTILIFQGKLRFMEKRRKNKKV